MGCDIHMLTEFKGKRKEEEQWFNCDHFSYNPYYEEGEAGEDRMNLESIYSARDYNLFARLAGVRKYNDEVQTISEPRGLPVDVSKVTLEYSAKYGSDGHSHSWLTYKELEEYGVHHAWDSITVKNLLGLMRERMKEAMWIWNENPTDEQKENFRIVFFFDN